MSKATGSATSSTSSAPLPTPAPASAETTIANVSASTLATAATGAIASLSLSSVSATVSSTSSNASKLALSQMLGGAIGGWNPPSFSMPSLSPLAVAQAAAAAPAAPAAAPPAAKNVTIALSLPSVPKVTLQATAQETFLKLIKTPMDLLIEYQFEIGDDQDIPWKSCKAHLFNGLRQIPPQSPELTNRLAPFGLNLEAASLSNLSGGKVCLPHEGWAAVLQQLNLTPYDAGDYQSVEHAYQAWKHGPKSASYSKVRTAASTKVGALKWEQGFAAKQVAQALRGTDGRAGYDFRNERIGFNYMLTAHFFESFDVKTNKLTPYGEYLANLAEKFDLFIETNERGPYTDTLWGCNFEGHEQGGKTWVASKGRNWQGISRTMIAQLALQFKRNGYAWAAAPPSHLGKHEPDRPVPVEGDSTKKQKTDNNKTEGAKK